MNEKQFYIYLATSILAMPHNLKEYSRFFSVDTGISLRYSQPISLGCMQHDWNWEDFEMLTTSEVGHPSKNKPRYKFLNFGDSLRTCSLNMQRPLTNKKKIKKSAF